MPSGWPDPSSLPDLSDHQREQYASAAHGCLGILGGRPGTGKAQPMDSAILMPYGWALMGMIRPGDFVIGSNGKPTEVVGVFPQGVKPTVTVTMSDGSVTRCTTDHLWFTTTRKEQKNKTWGGSVKTTSQIMQTLDRGDGHSNHQIPMVGPVEFEQRPMPLDPYLLGLLLGDGCFRGGSIGITNPEAFIIEEARKALPWGVCLVQSKHDPITYHARQPHSSGNIVTDAIRELGLMDKLAEDKHVPATYKFGSVATRIAVLNGLLDADASTDGHNVEFSTSSERLARDVEFLVQSLGGRVSVATRIPKYIHKGLKLEGQLSYRVLVMLPSSVAPFRLPRKAEKYIPRTKYQPRRAIVSIEPSEESECQCIQVAADDGLYVTDDCIVTHNTFTLARILAALASGRCGVAAPTGKAAVRITESLQRAGVQSMRASTIHSLLGPSRDDEDNWAFEHDESNPLDLDYIFVDEGSMLDCPLFGSLLAARAPGAKVMLIGDVNQLAPVGFGAPLRDLIAAKVPYGELTEIRRNAGRIVRCCHGIIDKHTFEPSPKLDLLAESPENLLHVERREPEAQIEALKTTLERFRQGATINERKVDPVWDCQVVVPVNEKSPLARVKLNAMLQGFLNAAGDTAPPNPFRKGDKVVCGKNGWVPTEQAIGRNLQGGPWNTGAKDGKVYVANGEQAVVLSVAQRFTVARLWLPDRVVRIPQGDSYTNEDGETEQTGCSWELAYALSVHKSQGSQWPVVITMADAYPGARMLCDRSWLYTALSRAETLGITIGQRDVLDEACRKSHIWNRKTFLVEAIQELQQEGSVHSWMEALA